MGVWTALILASQLLLKLSLHVEAQALGECYLKCFKGALWNFFIVISHFAHPKLELKIQACFSQM